MKPHRRRFSPSVYRAILVKQDWKCACCGEALFVGNPIIRRHYVNYHFDHILALELGGKDEPENLQALKRGHHAKKTHREASARAKTKRLIAQRGLRDKKMSAKDKVYAKMMER